MPDKTTIVALKLTAAELDALDKLVQQRIYKSRSAALRAGLMQVLEKNDLSLDARVAIFLDRVKHPMRRCKQADDE